ncbi:MAG TPA: hypothetical protein VF813_02385 [Anaerolineaceae bacterium]
MSGLWLTITRGKISPDQAEQSETFLSGFLPRLEAFPGVSAVYHYSQHETGESTTLVVWDSQEAAQSYRESALVQEAVAFEQANQMRTTREAYPLDFPAPSRFVRGGAV